MSNMVLSLALKTCRMSGPAGCNHYNQPFLKKPMKKELQDAYTPKNSNNSKKYKKALKKKKIMDAQIVRMALNVFSIN